MRKAFTIAASCGLAIGANPLGPGAGPWELETPEAHGLDAAGLEVAKDYLFESAVGGDHRDCFVVIKDGALVYESYSSETYNHTKHQGYSMTKTLGALIAGYVASSGNLDIDADITKTYGVKSPKPYPVTSRQIMSQSLAGADGPGEEWFYDGLGVLWINKMTEVVRAASGINASQIWRNEFESTLGFDSLTFTDADFMWATGSVGTCRDYARIGQLMLNKGKWLGIDKPIVSSGYIDAMASPQSRYKPYATYANPCYGLLTWLTSVGKGGTQYPGQCSANSPGMGTEGPWPEKSPSDIFYADGLKGQIVMVLPTHNAVVVSMGWNKHGPDVPVEMYTGLCRGRVFEDCGNSSYVVV